MSREQAKRSAIEPAATLFERERATAAPASRPATTSFGALLVLLRALAGLLWIGAFAVLWREIAAEAEVDAELRPFVFWLVVSIAAVWSLMLLTLAWAIWRGSNTARVLVLLGLTGSIVIAAIGYFAGGEEITVRTTLLTLALDILVLLALSSRDARAWARRPRAKRRDARRG